MLVLTAAVSLLLVASARAILFTPVQLWRCAADVAASPSQSWLLNATGLPDGSARVTLARAPAAASVWDLNGPSNKSGTSIHLYRPYDNPAQQWHYAADSGLISSPAFARGRCASALYPVAGAPLVLQRCAPGAAPLQRFAYDNATGALRLQADASLCVDAGSATNCSVPPTSGYAFCNTSAPPAARAADLAGRMQVEELAYFLGNGNVGVPGLGVPRLGYGEALHGLLRECLPTPLQNSTGCPTSFPHLLLLSGSFNRSLWRSVAHAIADEARAYFNLANRSSHLVSWAPDINPFRDPRCACPAACPLHPTRAHTHARSRSRPLTALATFLRAPPPSLLGGAVGRRWQARTPRCWQTLSRTTRRACRRTTRASSSLCPPPSTLASTTWRMEQTQGACTTFGRTLRPSPRASSPCSTTGRPFFPPRSAAA